MNTLDLAGVMALSSGLKANHVMRCLDLNIPPDDEEMARYVTLLSHKGYHNKTLNFCFLPQDVP
jgi:hypothetical protein